MPSLHGRSVLACYYSSVVARLASSIGESEARRFELLPAIDLRGGRVVRLRQGSFDREQVYSDDPRRVAERFRADGASWIHVVDLDGARAGERRQQDAVAATIQAASRDDSPHPAARVQVAGGLRDREAIAGVLAAGAARAVIGTIALRDPDVVRGLVAEHGPGAIAVALDVRDGRAVGEGWVPGAAGVPVAEALDRLTSAGITTFVVTAIERDGLLQGPNLALLHSVVAATRAEVIASGGISTIADLLAVRDLGCSGAIIGRALYDGTIDLRHALEAVSSTGRPSDRASDR